VRGPSQLVLDLPARPALGRSDFFVSPANRLALAQVDTWPRWPAGRLALAGPSGSGKTHLVHVWAARAQAQIVPVAELGDLDVAAVPGDAALAVEDADRIAALGAAVKPAEEALFHLCNLLSAGGGTLLVTGRDAPSRWTIGLADLASRLHTALVATLEPPDDTLLAAVLVKLFSDRGIGVAPEVIRYLAARMERSFAAAEDIVARLDRAGLASGRPIGLRLAAEVFAERAGLR
jgi:chromosomal replication initiation ATPase DnaA